jgi:type I restriction enzyme, S subunit
MRTDNLRIRSWGTIGDGYLGPAFHRRFSAGDVLYGSRRTYLRKVAVPDFDGVCANTTFVCAPADDRLLKRLLPFVMQSETFHAHSISKSKGSVNPYVNWKDLASYEFWLPPRTWQLHAVDRLEALEQTLRSYEDADIALAQAHAAFVDELMSGAVSKASVSELGALVDEDRPIAYGILKPGRHVEDGVPVIKVKDYPDGVISTTGLLRVSSDVDREYRRSRLAPGDLLVSIRGTVGRITEVPAELEGANITQDSARIALRHDIDREYVRAALESRVVQKQIAVRTVGLAVKGINLRDVRKLRVPMPQSEVRTELLDGVQSFKEARAELASARRRLEELKGGLIAYLLDGARA